MARRYWPGQSPIGKRVRFNGANEPWREVVGVIRDVRHWGLDREVNPEMYLPHEQQPSRDADLRAACSVAIRQRSSRSHAPGSRLRSGLPLGAVADDGRRRGAVGGGAPMVRRCSSACSRCWRSCSPASASTASWRIWSRSRTGEIGIRLTLGARPAAGAAAGARRRRAAHGRRSRWAWPCRSRRCAAYRACCSR